MQDKLEAEVKSIGEYLGCNEDELWSEMKPLIAKEVLEGRIDSIREAEKQAINQFYEEFLKKIKKEFPDGFLMTGLEALYIAEKIRLETLGEGKADG